MEEVAQKLEDILSMKKGSMAILKIRLMERFFILLKLKKILQP